MKKDIQIPVSNDVHMALVHEWNDEFNTHEWNAYLLNDGHHPLNLVFIVSKGYSKNLKTAVMRHSMEAMDSKSYQKIEFLQEEVLSLNNVFLVTYYAKGVLYEKKFLFKKNSVCEPALKKIPLHPKLGILAVDQIT